MSWREMSVLDFQKALKVRYWAALIYVNTISIKIIMQW